MSMFDPKKHKRQLGNSWLQDGENLNQYKIDDETRHGQQIEDFSILSGDIQVYFRNIEQILIEHIKKADVILGCVAWLTSFKILDALAEKQASIIVQKEDFLRPDIDASKSWKNELRMRYDKINMDISLAELSKMGLNYASWIEVQSVRCVGNHNREKKPAFPRMHNKFLLFCNDAEKENPKDFLDIERIVPYAVWTGSYNLTQNASQSLENAIYTTKEDIVKAYHGEWGQIFALSEPLDWTDEWCAPEFRIGS